MLANVLSSAVIGIDAYLVEVEVDIMQGLHPLPLSACPKRRSRKAKNNGVRSTLDSCQKFTRVKSRPDPMTKKIGYVCNL